MPQAALHDISEFQIVFSARPDRISPIRLIFAECRRRRLKSASAKCLRSLAFRIKRLAHQYAFRRAKQRIALEYKPDVLFCAEATSALAP